jgi:hypothetical protein
MTSYRHTAQGDVLYAQNLGYAHVPSLGYSHQPNAGYADQANTDLTYTPVPYMGYTHTSGPHGYDTGHNDVSTISFIILRYVSFLMLPFGSESFVIPPAVQECKG